MYILIKIGMNDSRLPILVSNKKSKLISHIKEKGFYYSKKLNKYIDDKNCGISGGSGTDYIINEIEELD